MLTQVKVEPDYSISMPKGWIHINLGRGNSLYMREEYLEPLKEAWDKYVAIDDGEIKILYRVWLDFLVNILKK